MTSGCSCSRRHSAYPGLLMPLHIVEGALLDAHGPAWWRCRRDTAPVRRDRDPGGREAGTDRVRELYQMGYTAEVRQARHCRIGGTSRLPRVRAVPPA